jgi:predicted metal-binding membrane protein
MLPGAAPAVARHARASGQLRAAPLFAGSYLAVWALAGVVAYALDRPHGSLAAGTVVIAAGAYEPTPGPVLDGNDCRTPGPLGDFRRLRSASP